MAKLNYGRAGGKGLSYSRRQTFHLCPRKFELENILNVGEGEDNCHFSFGHAVGAGIQSLVVEPTNLNKAVTACIANWSLGLFDELSVKKKSLWYAIRAVELFHEMLNNPSRNILKNYEVAMFKDRNGKLKPAVELQFLIEFHDEYSYEGHIDLVLKEKGGNTYIILELKTSSCSNLHEAMYKNSDQALGYSVVLDSIVSDLGARNSYHVLYLVYKSGRLEFETFVFPKSRTQRAMFINSLLLDIEVMEMYREYGIYPSRGQACYDFFSPCEFFETCHMSNETLAKFAKNHGDDNAKFRAMEDSEYDFIYHIEDIRHTQLEVIEQSLIAAGG